MGDHMPADPVTEPVAEPKRATAHVNPVQRQPASLADIINGIDWNRINAGLTYALLHGGNLPPGFMNDARRGGA